MLSTAACTAGRVARSAARLSSVVRHKHSLPDLQYDYNALEPVISADIMTLHHSKHHQTYVNNLNVAEEKYQEAVNAGNLTQAIALQSAIKFNGGGHLNHTIFWTNLAPQSLGGGEPPSGNLMKEIESTFGSFDDFKATMNTKTAAVQGSGWGWLGYNKTEKRLQIQTCANQDPLESMTGLVPLLGIDVWEHAYYLDYKNARPDYLKAIWEIVNWKNVTERYAAAKSSRV